MVVINEDYVMPSNVFSEELRLNSVACIDVLNSVVKPWRDGAHNGRHYVFHQDSVPSHKSHLTQEWMTKPFHDHTTLSFGFFSPQISNLSDYYMWSVVKRKVNTHPITLYTNPSLQKLILKALTRLDIKA